MARSKLTIPLYSTRLDDALVFVADQFRHRVRKGTVVPYLTHLLQVMVTVAEHGGDEDQLVAALLHDYLEDIRGASRSLLAERWGERVAWLVEALSDSTTHPKPPWEQRKRAYVEQLRTAEPAVKLVSAADKLHNAASVLRDLQSAGPAVFERFTASREQTLWYYRAVTEALAHGWAHPLVDELDAVVGRLEHEARRGR
ncbi:MAG: HD domain-containing protein [Myxococcota bacterium]